MNSLLHALAEKIDTNAPNGCWHWTGARMPKGYGRLRYRQKALLAHRTMFRICVREVTPKEDVHHKCENTQCVNPAHLEALSRGCHIRRGTLPAKASARWKAKFAAITHCKHGHEFSPENTYAYERDGRVHRKCRACDLRRANQKGVK